MQGKRYLIALLVIVFLVGVPGSGYCYFITGNDLVKYSREYEKYAKDHNDPTTDQAFASFYMGYIAGVANFMDLVGLVDLEGTTIQQICLVVAKFLNHNPERWGEQASLLVSVALSAAFPKEQ